MSAQDAVLAQAMAIAETIREMHEVPAGVLFAGMMVHGMSHDSFEQVIAMLTRSKLITRKNHVLTWIGPKID